MAARHAEVPPPPGVAAQACGRLRFWDDGLMCAVAGHMSGDDADPERAGPSPLALFSAQAIGNIVHACGRLGFRHDGMLREVCSNSRGRLREFTHQNVSNVLHGMAALEYRDEARAARHERRTREDAGGRVAQGDVFGYS